MLIHDFVFLQRDPREIWLEKEPEVGWQPQLFGERKKKKDEVQKWKEYDDQIERERVLLLQVLKGQWQKNKYVFNYRYKRAKTAAED